LTMWINEEMEPVLPVLPDVTLWPWANAYSDCTLSLIPALGSSLRRHSCVEVKNMALPAE